MVGVIFFILWKWLSLLYKIAFNYSYNYQWLLYKLCMLQGFLLYTAVAIRKFQLFYNLL